MSTSSSRRFKPVSTILLMLVVYLLSFGPVRALYSSHRLEGPFPEGLVTFYKPVNWSYEHTPLGKPMAVYDDWWNGALKRS